MSTVDWIVLGVVAVGLAVALIFGIKRRKKQGCSGSCEACNGCNDRFCKSKHE